MEEGKTIFVIGFESTVAIAFLGIFALVMIVVGALWNNHERSEMHQEEMKEYASIAAYDDTDVRAQDVMSLISTSKGEPFVLIFDEGYNLIGKSYDAYTADFKITNTTLSKLANPAPFNTIVDQTVSSLDPGADGYVNVDGGTSNTNTQNFFLNGLGTSVEGKYSAYHTHVLYADNTSEIIGVLAVRR